MLRTVHTLSVAAAALCAALLLPSSAHAQVTCGTAQGGSCLEPHGNGGCSDLECCQTVCAIYPDCCIQQWDQFCVELANSECNFLCGASSAGSCFIVHNTTACDDEDCCAEVCAIDPGCCQFGWDLICAFEAQQFCDPPSHVPCGAPNSGSCTVAHGTPSCNDSACCELVCGFDPSCCSTAWDMFCVGFANSYCYGCSLSCPSGSTAENELCGARSNDACLGGQTPQTITCGATVCGQIDGQTQGGLWNGDRDAYLFTATDSNSDGLVRITLRLACEFKGFAVLVPATCPVNTVSAPLHVDAQNCLQSSAAACVPPGNYWVLVSPGTYPSVGQSNALLCQSDPKYSLQVECSQITCGNPCSPSSGSCYEVHANPGCNETACCSTVCNADPYCCNTAWDSDCVISAGQSCGQPAPANDECVNAATILTGQTLSFNTVSATISQPALPASCEQGQGITIGPDVWFKYVATCGGNLAIGTCGSSTDMRLAIYTGDCAALTLAVCNTDSQICQPVGGSRVQFVATCGQTYLIRVGGDTPSDVGPAQLFVTCPGPACPGNCPADFDGNQLVDGADLGTLLGSWGTPNHDLTGDGTVDGADLGTLLGEWGACN